jgi:hypothetical protein
MRGGWGIHRLLKFDSVPISTEMETVMRKMIGVMSGLLLAACSVVGLREGTEEPHFSVVARVGAVEIRQYGPRIAAETAVADDEEGARSVGFRRLAGYIFGANQGGTKIAMTAPVAQQGAGTKIAMTAPVGQAQNADGAWVIRFYMPAEWTLALLPQPRDPLVHLVQVPGETMAVLRFSGDRGPKAVEERQAALLKALDGSGWHADGAAMAWFYDPPWTLPWLRRNEVAVQVERKNTP